MPSCWPTACCWLPVPRSIHIHFDHLDKATIQRLMAAGQQPRFQVPPGVKEWFTEQGIDKADELDWWDERKLDSCGKIDKNNNKTKRSTETALGVS